MLRGSPDGCSHPFSDLATASTPPVSVAFSSHCIAHSEPLRRFLLTFAPPNCDSLSHPFGLSFLSQVHVVTGWGACTVQIISGGPSVLRRVCHLKHGGLQDELLHRGERRALQNTKR